MTPYLLSARATGTGLSAGGVCGRHRGLDAEAARHGRRLPAVQAQRVLDQDQEARNFILSFRIIVLKQQTLFETMFPILTQIYVY